MRMARRAESAEGLLSSGSEGSFSAPAPDRALEGSDGFDSAAEERLVRAFGPRIFVMAVVRTRDRSAAQDLAQDALLAAIEALRAGRLRDPVKLPAFVYGTARNVINNYLRTRRRVPVGEPLSETAGADGSQVRDLEASERLALVTRALARLAPRDRRLLEMTLVDGSDPDEIPGRLGLTSEAARQRKCRAIKKIMRIVATLSQG